MDDKVLTEDVFVEHLAKDLILEQVAVSGMLYVTIDKKLLSKHRFNDNVKVHIVLDNNVDDHKENNQLPSGDEVNENLSNTMDSCEDEDVLIDDALRMKFGTNCKSEDTVISQEAKPILAEEESIVLRKRKRAVKSSKKKATGISKSKSKLSVTKKRIASKRKSTKNLKVKANAVQTKKRKIKEIEAVKTEFDEDDDNSDPHDLDNDSNDEEAQVKSEDDNSDASITDPSKIVTCPYCNKSFKNQKKLAEHRKVERQHYPCPKCHRVLRYKAYLMIHMRDHHQEKKPKVDHPEGKKEKCDICGSFFSCINNLKLHLMSHTNEHQFQCCVCPEKLLLAQSYERHMATHSKIGRFQCKICKVRVDSRSELAKHKLNHPYHCGLCGKEFPNKTERFFHYKTSHKDDILKCPLCDMMYSCQKALDKHLKYHRNRHHTQCPICGLFFFRLPEHMLSTHPPAKADGESVFVCDKCPKQYTKKKSFDRHLKTHVEEKSYTCPECSKQFAHSKGLSTHYMAVHLQEKPYVCKVCGKACSQKGNLKVHMRVHKTDAPSKVIQCSQCGASFTHKNALQEHINKEHRVDENVLQFPQQYFQMNTFYPGSSSQFISTGT